MRSRFARRVAPLACLLLLIAGAGFGADEGVKITSDTFGGIRARSIGPATMSGRIAAIAAVPEDPLTVYVGSASGGVWKSVDAGTTFKPVFDEHTQSIGAIAIDPSEPKTVWVGTGESWMRNSVSAGDGVYRSADAGDTWENMGLKDTEHIARILVSPKDSSTVYVCAPGHLWNANEERGVFKTTDGGKTWKKVLYVNADTGCSDLAMDPQEPRILYAGMWQFRRSPDFFTSGGPGSALYRSTDGGETWKELKEGLPAGEKGRIAVAVAPSRPSVLYAVVEAKETALYRSEDLGESWSRVNSSFNVKARPFYFGLVVVDPTDPNTVYKPGLTLSVSTDGGRSFTSPFTGDLMGGSVHSDLHALWINPKNPNEMYLGTDGGVYQSTDKAHHWRFLRSLPVAQFYHVSVDNEHPYNVYGGLQDNGTWRGPSRAPGGIQNRNWDNVGFGDGFWAFADPRDPDTLYVEYQGGELLRTTPSTGEVKSIKPYARKGEAELRFNWNAPIHISPNDPATIYVGSQFLLRSRDRGESWEQISPDLTTNDPARQRQKQSGGLSIDNSTAENNTTIFTISESPKNPQLIWVGTDDGNLQLTRDGGKSWTNLVGHVPGLPKATWVSYVWASPHAEGTAYATFDGHASGDMKTYVYETTDFGQSWRSLVTPEIHGWAHVIKDDPVNAELLFLGTERGLWLSLDGGREWARFTGDLPPVAVDDLTVQSREGDLVIATHGRGVYIIDDLTPIRALTAETLEKSAALLPSRPAEMVMGGNLQDFPGDDEFVGRNPPEAAMVTYWLKKRHIFGDLKVEVYGSDGKLITTLPGGKRVGINRVPWPMRLPPPKVPPASSLTMAFVGPRAAEGTYTVKLIKGKETYEGTVTLVADARSPHSPEDRALQQKTAMRLYGDLERLTYTADTLTDVRDQARARAEKLGSQGSLARRLNSLADEVEKLRTTVVSTAEGGWLSGDEQLREKLASLYGSVTQYEGRPTDSQLERADALEGDLQQARGKLDAVTARELPGVNAALGKKHLEPITVASFEEWKAKQEKAGEGSSSAVVSRRGATLMTGLFASFRLAS
jgi:photosystem II stability/assembly factor-like uncharacterized protein